MAESSERISTFKSLDALRGLAALWVVMDHSCDRYVTTVNLQHWPIYAVSLRGQLGVVIFFLISGYCIVAAAYRAFAAGKKVRRFALDRLRRIYPPYFASIVAGFAAIQFLAFAQAHHLTPPIHHQMLKSTDALFWLSNLFLVQSEAHQPLFNIVFWSLCFEVSFYAIIGVLLFVTQRIQKQWNAQTGLFFFSLAISALTLESLVFQIRTGRAGPFPLDLWYQFGLGGLFFLCMEIDSPSHKGFSLGLRRLHRVEAAVVVGVTALFGWTQAFGGSDIAHPSSRVQVVTALACFAGFWIMRRVERYYVFRPVLQPLFWLGSFSYSLYLIHPVILPFFEVLGRRLGLTGNLYVINWIIQIFAAIVAGWLFFLAVERRFISSRQKDRARSELQLKFAAEKVISG